MRNLSLVSEEVLSVPDASLLGWCIDADNDVLYACGRSTGASATNIWRCNSSVGSCLVPRGPLDLTRHVTPQHSLQHFASVDDSTEADIAAPTSSPSSFAAFTFLAESRAICVIFRDGRLVTVQSDTGTVGPFSETSTCH